MRRKATLVSGIFLLLFIAGRLAFGQLPPEDPTKGARLFVSKGCVKCHALKGEGGKIGPDFGRIDLGDSQLDLAGKMWNHIPSMIIGMERVKMVKPSLTGRELSDLSAYLYFLKFFDEPGNPTKGRYVFTEKGCHLCHPLSAKGKAGEPGLNEFPQNISPVFLSQAIWNHGPNMIAQMVKLGIKWPEFTGTEMMDLLEYIRANAKGGSREMAFVTPGSPRDGKRVFQAKGCIKCHGEKAEDRREGGDLGKKARAFYKSLTQIASSMWNKGPVVLAKMSQTPMGIPNFTPKEMADLLSYLYFLHFTGEPGNGQNGKRLFRDLGCARCHGMDGKNGELMQIDLSKYQRTAEVMEIVSGIWNHSSEIDRAMREKGLSWPRLKKGEMADLLEYIRTARKDRKSG